MTVSIKIPKVKCKRCGYKWTPNSLEKPTRCAWKDCRSPYWDVKPKSKKVIK